MGPIFLSLTRAPTPEQGAQHECPNCRNVREFPLGSCVLEALVAVVLLGQEPAPGQSRDDLDRDGMAYASTVNPFEFWAELRPVMDALEDDFNNWRDHRREVAAKAAKETEP